VGGLGIAEIATVIQNPEDGRYSPNALFFVGTGLAISGALIRAWCFQTMGSMFTFDIGIDEKQHRLVDTGPYAFVRSAMNFLLQNHSSLTNYSGIHPILVYI